MTMEFKLDHKGASEVLKELAAGEIHALGRQVFDEAGEGAYVHHYITDRAAASVSIPAARQAKHGALTKAASAAGLEVHAKGEKFAGVSATPVVSKRGERWTADEIHGIFEGSAADVSRRTGRSVSAVRSQRQSIARGR